MGIFELSRGTKYTIKPIAFILLPNLWESVHFA